MNPVAGMISGSNPAIALARRRITFGYTNWESRHARRQVETRFMYFGTLEQWYPGHPAQWYLVGIDVDKNTERSFQMGRMEGVEVLS